MYNSFAPGRKEQSQSAHEALLRAKLLSNEHSECKQDCTEGTDYCYRSCINHSLHLCSVTEASRRLL